MKSVWLIRHAKSSWKVADLADVERPLNKRGNRDAPFIGKLLKKVGVQPDLILTSTAVRAHETGRLIANELHYPEDKIVVDERLYLAGVEEILNLIRTIDQSVSKLTVVGHNPGLTRAANAMSNFGIEKMPTCSVVGIDFNVSSWKEVATGTLTMYEYPKKYLR
jgi:phosphohistidine phosphatase